MSCGKSAWLVSLIQRSNVDRLPVRDARHRTHWSHWRRRHQHRARACHYQRQLTQDRNDLRLEYQKLATKDR
jgi:hypothetical protein